MKKSLSEYCFKPCARVALSTIVSLVTLNFKELYTNLFFRLPFVVIFGTFSLLSAFWFKWYIISDLIQMNVFRVFDPGSTARRILKNFLCPKEVVGVYTEYIDTPEFRNRRIKFSLQS